MCYILDKVCWTINERLLQSTALVIQTVEPHYKEDLGTMKITWLYQVSCYIRVKKKINKELGPAKLPCYKRVLLYLTSLTLKGPGFFVYLKSGVGGGGGGDSAPPSDLGHGVTKHSEIWHVRRVSWYEHADKIAILKIKAFLNYANFC